MQELTKYRHESSENLKKQSQKVEDLSNDQNKYRAQIETLKKEKKECEARVQALESLLDGLRKEKQLWSQELAHQGNHL